MKKLYKQKTIKNEAGKRKLIKKLFKTAKKSTEDSENEDLSKLKVQNWDFIETISGLFQKELLVYVLIEDKRFLKSVKFLYQKAVENGSEP